MQSHISESHDAVAFSAALHPEVEGRDIQLFDTAGLLTSPVRLAAHQCCVSKEAWRLALGRLAPSTTSNLFELECSGHLDWP